MMGETAKQLLVDLLEDLNTRLLRAEKLEEAQDENRGPQGTKKWNDRKKALERIRDEITLYRFNL